MTSYVLDIETIPFEPVYTAWKENNKDKDFEPPFVQQMVCMGSAEVDDNFRLTKLGFYGIDETEKEGIVRFSADVTRTKAALVTWNGRNFDLPVISYRSMHYGIQLPWLHDEKSAYKIKFVTTKHFDLMEFVADYGWAKPSLDYMAKLLGLPGKMDTKGSQVRSLYEEGKLDEIVSYCATDVIQTYFILLRVLIMRGRMNAEYYNEVTAGTLDLIKREGSLEVSSDNVTVLGNDATKKSTLAIAKGCRIFLSNLDLQKIYL